MANNNFLRKPYKKHTYYYVLILIIYLLATMALSMIVYSYSLTNSIKDSIFEDLYAALKWAVKLPSVDGLFKTAYIKPSFVFFKKFWALHLIFALILFYKYTLPPPSEWRGMEYASGRMAKAREKQHYIDRKDSIPIAKNFYVPIKSHPYKPHWYSKAIMQYSPQNLNQVVFAGSGAGKTLRQVMPQLMALTGNYIVVDPKQEIFKSTYKYFNKNGYEIRVLNFYDISYSDRYNPMAYVHSEQDVIKVAELFMKSTAGDAKSDFWSDSAKLVFSAIMLYLYNCKDEEKSFGRALRLLSTLKVSEGQGIDPECEFSQRMVDYCSEDEHYNDMCYIMWQDIQSTPAVTLGGQLSTLKVRLSLFYTKSVANLTSVDELHLRDFAEEGRKIILYVCLPPADSTYNALTTLFFAQMISELQYCCNQSALGKLPTLLNVICDEFANINKIDDWLKFISVNRSLNCRIVHILQNLQQLKGIYKEDYETLLSNCSIFTALGSSDQSTLKLICDSIGKMNVKVQTQNYNFGTHSQGGGTKNNSIIGRDIQPNELKEFFGVRENKGGVIYNKNCIVFIDLEFAYALEKFDTLNNETYKNEFGSPFKGQEHNLTDIKDVFAAKKKKKEEEQMLKEQKELEAKKEQVRQAEQRALEIIEEELKKEEEEQEFLRKLFDEMGDEVSDDTFADMASTVELTQEDIAISAEQLSKGYSKVSEKDRELIREIDRKRAIQNEMDIREENEDIIEQERVLDEMEEIEDEYNEMFETFSFSVEEDVLEIPSNSTGTYK